MDILTLVGFVGATCILVAFFQVSRGAWKGTSWQFQLVNLAGALLLVFYSWMLSAYALAILNAIWVLVACVGLYKYLAGKT